MQLFFIFLAMALAQGYQNISRSLASMWLRPEWPTCRWICCRIEISEFFGRIIAFFLSLGKATSLSLPPTLRISWSMTGSSLRIVLVLIQGYPCLSELISCWKAYLCSKWTMHLSTSCRSSTVRTVDVLSFKSVCVFWVTLHSLCSCRCAWNFSIQATAVLSLFQFDYYSFNLLSGIIASTIRLHYFTSSLLSLFSPHRILEGIWCGLARNSGPWNHLLDFRKVSQTMWNVISRIFLRADVQNPIGHIGF